MLKYVDAKVTFSEVPNEITLCVSISGCKIGCKGCHSEYLSEDIGRPLTWESLCSLIYINTGVTCVCFMGGDSSPELINKLAWHTKRAKIKTAWYSGRQELSKKIDLDNFDFIKLGPYIESLGPLTSKTTNQKFYKIYHTKACNRKCDITYKFWKND
jgi:anaerobic ribonucleoside-triphosphate reductase activating protein